MKIQDLAIIFIIIIVPISIVLSAYTQFQIETLNLQTLYDTKLTSATYDAIRAFQINTANSTMSELSNSKMRDIEASVTTFKNSIMSTFGLNGYSDEELDNYIPALVYTMYDGFYIYSPYENTNYLYETETKPDGTITYKLDSDGNKIPLDDNGETMYGLKPYITYSCRYDNGNMDIVITYSLDNFITISGTINGKYINDEGYLIDGITQDASGNIFYNGVHITTEQNLTEWIGEGTNGKYYPYIKLNGTKYYYDDGNGDTSKAEIFYISNGTLTTQGDYKGAKAVQFYNDVIKNNDSAIKYYKKAMEFTDRVKGYGIGDLTYDDAYEMVKTGAVYTKTKLWSGDTRKIFVFNTDTTKPEKNIECEMSNYNQHRLAVIRQKIESNLSIAISNYNKYSKVREIQFQMPQLKEEEWNSVMNNISLISFVQGLYIGGKVYNGYTVVNNSESKEVIREENIYILGKDKYYHRIGDNYLNDENNIQTATPAGRVNLDFKRKSILINSGTNSKTVYYYPLRDYNASYSSIVTQNDVTTYDDIYAYINSQNDTLKKVFYTALGREREGQYKFSNDSAFNYNVLVVGYTTGSNHENTIRNITNKLNEYDYINATYIFSSDATYLANYMKSQRNNYQLMIVDSFVWNLPDVNTLKEVAKSTSLLTISNDAIGLPMMKGSPDSQSVSVTTNMTPQLTSLGQQKLGLSINARSDSAQALIKFNNDVKVLCRGVYSGGKSGTYDTIGYWENGTHRWVHSQISFSDTNENEMKVLERLVYYAMYGLD